MVTSGCSQLGCKRIPRNERSVTASECVLAVYTRSSGMRLDRDQSVKVVIVVWGDGTIIWSSDLVRGGSPYRKARIDPEKISKVLSELSIRGAFEPSHLTESKMGPSSTFTTILIRNLGKELKMESWHELQEIDGKGIASDDGVGPLKGKKLWSSLENEPADYLHYRMCWLEIKLAAFSLLPTSGEMIDAIFVEQDSELYFKLDEDETLEDRKWDQ
jgi:hypothetical protein